MSHCGQNVGTVDSLVFALVVDKVEISQDFDGSNMCSSIINNSFRSVFDQKFK